MRTAIALLLLAACGGPSQQQIIETPAATAPYRHTEAPPASVSDEDRHHLNQQFEDMETTQEAYREAEGERPPPPTPAQAQPPKKIGPAEAAPTVKKKGPAEAAPK
jgi:hypothetical protein